MTVTTGFRPRGAALVLAFAVATAVGVGVSSAQDAAEVGVVARVGGNAITETDLAAGIQELGDQLSRMPGDPRSNLIDILVNFQLAADAAAAEGLEDDPDVAALVDVARKRALYLAYMRSKITEAVTEQAVHARFDEELADFVPGEEIHVRHILVQTEDEAEAVIAELDDGADFEAIAKEKSIDPGSKDRGGDLDFIGHGATVEPFDNAAFELAVGEYTETPVQSQFGWHVIRVDETRDAPPPSFDDEAQRIQSELLAETVNQTIDGLRAGADIEIVSTDEPAEGEAPAGDQ
jgi:peptidyl-prolyl cis-trans isomerase C